MKFSRFTALLAALAVFSVAGCAPPPTTDAEVKDVLDACNGSFACTVATLVERDINDERGKNFGGGVILRGAKSDGKTLILGLDVPARFVDEPVRNGKGPKAQVRDILASSMCKRPYFKPFVNDGGRFRLITYLPDGKVFTDDTLSSCS